MKEIIVYEMRFDAAAETIPQCAVPHNAEMVPFAPRYAREYIEKYNRAFHDMREALEIEPYDFYKDISQLRQNAENTFLLLRDGKLCGGVSCYGREVDDLFVAEEYQKTGMGRLLLRFGINKIYENGGAGAITLHAAEWNGKAVELYLSDGFKIVKKEKVR